MLWRLSSYVPVAVCCQRLSVLHFFKIWGGGGGVRRVFHKLVATQRKEAGLLGFIPSLTEVWSGAKVSDFENDANVLNIEVVHWSLPVFLGKSVMLYAAETIPKLKTRTQKIGSNDQSLQQGEGGKKGKGKKKKWPHVWNNCYVT